MHHRPHSLLTITKLIYMKGGLVSSMSVIAAQACPCVRLICSVLGLLTAVRVENLPMLTARSLSLGFPRLHADPRASSLVAQAAFPYAIDDSIRSPDPRIFSIRSRLFDSASELNSSLKLCWHRCSENRRQNKQTPTKRAYNTLSNPSEITLE